MVQIVCESDCWRGVVCYTTYTPLECCFVRGGPAVSRGACSVNVLLAAFLLYTVSSAEGLVILSSPSTSHRMFYAYGGGFKV